MQVLDSFGIFIWSSNKTAGVFAGMQIASFDFNFSNCRHLCMPFCWIGKKVKLRYTITRNGWREGVMEPK